MSYRAHDNIPQVKDKGGKGDLVKFLDPQFFKAKYRIYSIVSRGL